MSAGRRWVDLDGAVNVRDLGGLETVDGGSTHFDRVLRSDNLQDLSKADVERLTETLGVREVIDLRSVAEVLREGPGPLISINSITIHNLSLFSEVGRHTEVVANSGVPGVDIDKALPWHTPRDRRAEAQDNSIARYLNYFAERPDSIVTAVRLIAHGEGATVVHCAAGKDRTGVVCALTLDAVGVTREAIVHDYTQTGERIEALLDRLRMSDTYAADINARPVSASIPQPYFMEKLLTVIAERHGGALGWLEEHGWTAADQRALCSRLLE